VRRAPLAFEERLEVAGVGTHGETDTLKQDGRRLEPPEEEGRRARPDADGPDGQDREAPRRARDDHRPERRAEQRVEAEVRPDRDVSEPGLQREGDPVTRCALDGREEHDQPRRRVQGHHRRETQADRAPEPAPCPTRGGIQCGVPSPGGLFIDPGAAGQRPSARNVCRSEGSPFERSRGGNQPATC
jgi:hypothetical protein